MSLLNIAAVIFIIGCIGIGATALLIVIGTGEMDHE